MTTLPDDTSHCDRCGTDVTPGGLDKAVVVSDVGEDGLVVNLHFCREKKCDRRVLSRANVKYRLERKNIKPTRATPTK